MSVVRFISDTHFYHENMAKKRGFDNAHEMNEFIVSQWNRVVSKRDVTWMLGDITMEKSNYEILNRLNGIKKVVLGNHDEPQHIKDLLKYVNSVSGMVKYTDKVTGNKIFLTHCPIHPMELEHRVKFNIHGHIHDGYQIEDSRYMNVSAEIIDYEPKLLTELYEIYNR